MLDTLNQWILAITRPALDWILNLHPDARLFVVAIGTALILTVVRVFTTDQKKLKQCKEDKARLKQLIREAKKRGDKEAVARHKVTINQIGLVTMKSEGLPLLASLVPIALLAVWAFSSIAYHAPQDGDTVTVKMTFPKTEIGKVTHLLPVEGVTAETGLIRPVVKDYDRIPKDDERRILESPRAMREHLEAEAKAQQEYEAQAALAEKEGRPAPEKPEAKALPQVSNGLAEWRLTTQGRKDPYTLAFMFDGQRYERPLWVDGVHYADPIVWRGPDDRYAIETVLTEYKPFGVVPGIEMLWLQAWIVGYLIIVVPFSLILKPVLRIY
jgi:uncharacterized membrane protein (DUF106 family)